MKESQIRDTLAQNLHLLNPSFKLLDKEAYLPSVKGTRSFIDIFAHDENGKYVVIELKKSNATARQALHELFKYLEAIKENLAIKNDDIELIIVSTEWDELLVPFSSFKSNVKLYTKGFQLFIDGNNISVKEINTNSISEERILSSIQMARYYYSQESLQIGIKEHFNYFTHRGVNSFALLILKAPNNYKELVLNSINGFQEEIFKNISKEDFEAKIDYQYMIYSVNQLLSLEKYEEICLKYFNSTDNEEIVRDILENDKATLYDKMEQLNDLILEQEPFPISDFSEIGTPAKYNKFIEDEKWELIEIKRFGPLNENKFLDDHKIEEEVIASGTTGERYTTNIDFKNIASISRAKREIKNCLSDNIVWRNHIIEIIDLLENEKQKIKSVRCSIYNPMNIVYSIYLICTDPSGILYIPSYQIEVKLEDEDRMYIGYIDGNLIEKNINEILSKFWNSNPTEFLLTLTWGGYYDNNLELCDFIGLNYKTMMIKKVGTQREFFQYRNYQFIESEYFNHLENLIIKLYQNNSLVSQILSFFDNHNAGNGMWHA